jgi:hypothetical protein
MNDINILENIDEMYTCECGSIFFDEFQAKTYLDSNFISYGPNSSLTCNDRSITIVKCILCNKVHIPRTSFAGRNVLDRQVQLYATLYQQVNNANEKSLVKLPEETICDSKKETVKDVKTEPDSTEDNKDVVQKLSRGSTVRKVNKK